MTCLKCLVCNNNIYNSNTTSNNYNNNGDCNQLFYTVCSLLDLDSDLDLDLNNLPLTIPNVFCGDCQVTAVKLLNLQNSLTEIQQSIKTTITTITKTIIQTEDLTLQQQLQQEENNNGEKNKRKNFISDISPCQHQDQDQDNSGQFGLLEVEIKQEEVGQDEENYTTIQMISNLRKTVYARFTPVIKVAPFPIQIEIKSAENTNKVQNKVISNNIPTRRKSERRRRIKKAKFEEYVPINNEDENYDDAVNDVKDEVQDDFENGPPSIGKLRPRRAKTPRLSSSAETNSNNANENNIATETSRQGDSNPVSASQLPVMEFNENDYRYTEVIRIRKKRGGNKKSGERKEVTRWKCPKCTSSFGRGKNLYLHFIKRHEPNAKSTNQKPISVPIPGKPGHFTYAEKWEYEIKGDVKTGATYNCLTCNFWSTTKRYLTKHIDRDHNFTPRYACVTCKKSYVHENIFKSHHCKPKEVVQKQRVTELPDGSFLFDDKFPFVKIEDEADVDGTGVQFQCSVCNAKRKLYCKILHHMKIKHVNPGRHLCSECGKAFSTAACLRAHTQSLHSTEAAFTCEFCGRPFKVKNNLYAHTQRHHSETKFKCVEEGCEKIYKNKEDLRQHCKRFGHSIPPLFSWNDTQVLPCSRCGSKFRSVRAVKSHQFTCTGMKKKQAVNKKYTCRECAKTFFTQQQCLEHEFSHTKERLTLLSPLLSTTSTITNSESESTATSSNTAISQYTTEDTKTEANTDMQVSVMNDE